MTEIYFNDILGYFIPNKISICNALIIKCLKNIKINLNIQNGKFQGSIIIIVDPELSVNFINGTIYDNGKPKYSIKEGIKYNFSNNILDTCENIDELNSFFILYELMDEDKSINFFIDKNFNFNFENNFNKDKIVGLFHGNEYVNGEIKLRGQFIFIYKIANGKIIDYIYNKFLRLIN